MFKTFGTAAILGMTVATIAAADPIRVSKVEVTAEFTDMDSATLRFWPTIEADVGTALAAEVVELAGTEAQDVYVRIHEVDLDGSPLLGEAGEFNHLKARVIARPEGTTGTTADFEVELLAAAAPVAGGSPDAIIIPPIEGDFYNALIASFAATVADELAEIDTGLTQSGIFEETAPADDSDDANDSDDDDGSVDGTDGGTEGTPDDDSTDGGGTDGTDDGATDDGATDGGTDDGATDDGAADDGATDDGATDDGATDDGAASE